MDPLSSSMTYRDGINEPLQHKKEARLFASVRFRRKQSALHERFTDSSLELSTVEPAGS